MNNAARLISSTLLAAAVVAVVAGLALGTAELLAALLAAIPLLGFALLIDSAIR